MPTEPRLYTQGLKASPLAASLAGPATTWPLVSALVYPAYAATLLGQAALDHPIGMLAGVALRAASGALPRWIKAGAVSLLAPRAIAPAPAAAAAGPGLWEAAEELLGAAGALDWGSGEESD
jgi:hypothetical protein